MDKKIIRAGVSDTTFGLKFARQQIYLSSVWNKRQTVGVKNIIIFTKYKKVSFPLAHAFLFW